MTQPRVLIAGIGNVFLGDDGFGVEVVRRLSSRTLPPGVVVKDFGIRGFDLACALVDAPEWVILVDAAQRGSPPGTVEVMIPDSTPLFPGGPPPRSPEMHGLIPSHALVLARRMGAVIGHLRVVSCEPMTFGDPGIGCVGLSKPVALAVDEAVRMIATLVEEFLNSRCTNLP